ncbi:hypothetical protein PCCS19_20980 [Paenibacillus sp. CCS19]|uniref:hypothetical protein n=1 Tax=Paenibacillus sp. CCS19 TaxID=3158387 RepID=UPI002565631C|nr:hypothetical protein [Paenibacillus cellulosilyticus]GMK39044.1 hypothetical protein PCCS19_20980 [Paenibacillus cellulosilyticus]
MLTFSANPTVDQVQKAASAVVPNKSIKQLNEFERIGLSEGFVKMAEGKLTKPEFNAGAFGCTIERNIKMSVIDREIPLISSEEYEAGVRGVSETYVQVDSFANNDSWLESLRLNISMVKEVFDLMEDHIIEQERQSGKRYVTSLSATMKNALSGNCRSMTTLSRLVQDYKDFNFLQVPQCKIVMIDFLKDVNSLGGLIEYILRHRELGEALGLYDNNTLTA